MVKFLSFGCWNKGGCSPDSGMRKVINKAKEPPYNDVDFYIITGDNYYQDKNKKLGNKMVNIEKLENGFNCLNEFNKEIFLLMGNHDLEETDDRCETMIFEKDFSERVNSQSLPPQDKIHIPNKLDMFKEIDENTLIIMIDTNIYTGENPYCYSIIIPQYESFVTGSNKNDAIEQNNKLIAEQYQIIKTKLEYDKSIGKNYTNIIVCGHHPLIGFKNQTMKDKNGKSKVKGGLDVYGIEFYNLFLEVIQLYANHFFYLCADIHNYQKGIVTITKPDLEPMIIQQYIVGTGGADLDDDYNNQYSLEYGTSGYVPSPEPVLTANLNIKDITLEYSIQEHWSNYGFIIVDIKSDGAIDVTSVQIDETPIGGKRKRKRKTIKNKKSKRKTKKTNKTRKKNRN